MGFVSQEGTAYRDLSEFLAVAAENQLLLELGEPHQAEEKESAPAHEDLRSKGEAPPAPSPSTSGSGTKSPGPGKGRARGRRVHNRAAPASTASSQPTATMPPSDLDRFLALPDLATLPLTEHEDGGTDASLSPFTNRLNPLVVPIRVLANMMQDGAPQLDAFTRIVPPIARAVGLRLREADEDMRRRGRDKRWTGWPVGDDEVSSLARFRKHFMLSGEGDVPSGPLADLGLVRLHAGAVLLTVPGSHFAAEKTPILDEGDGGLLSGLQQDILRNGLLRMRGERRALQELFSAIHDANGSQPEVDRLLSSAHEEWTEAQVVSYRAAMVGRLRDLGLIDVTSPTPGQEITIFFEESAQTFEHRLHEDDYAATTGDSK